MTTDRPAAVSIVCTNCGGLIKPEYLKSAVVTREDLDDGAYRLQYDHDECPGLRRHPADGPDTRPPMADLLAMLS